MLDSCCVFFAYYLNCNNCYFLHVHIERSVCNNSLLQSEKHLGQIVFTKICFSVTKVKINRQHTKTYVIHHIVERSVSEVQWENYFDIGNGAVARWITWKPTVKNTSLIATKWNEVFESKRVNFPLVSLSQVPQFFYLYLFNTHQIS